MQIAEFDYVDPSEREVKPFLRGPAKKASARSPAGSVSDRQLAKLSELFTGTYDRDRSHEMALSEVPALFAQMGLPITDAIFKEYLQAQPSLTDGERKESNAIRLEEVHQFYRIVLAQQPECVKRVAGGQSRFSTHELQSQERSLRSAFAAYDVDNVGVLPMEDVKQVLSDLGLADLDGDNHDAFVKDMFQATGHGMSSKIPFADLVYFCNASVSGAVASREYKTVAAVKPPKDALARWRLDGKAAAPPVTPRAKREWSQPATPRGAMSYKPRTPRPL
jgi:Ca2+-binding EF-hand superfamily protein